MQNVNRNINSFIIQHIYSKNNNFSGLDTEEEFEKNLQLMPSDWHYRTKKITYKYNSSGYRTYEWKDIDWKNAITVLGCSHIFGTGLAEDETMCYQIEKLTGRQTVNLGYGGGSNEIILYNVTNMINNFEKPYAIIIGWTSIDRFILFNKEDHFNVGQWIVGSKRNNLLPVKDFSIQKRFYDLNSFNKQNLCTKNYLLIQQVKAMCKNINYYYDFSFFYDTAKELDLKHFSYTGKARDLKHPGLEINKEIAEIISKEINSLKNR